MKKRTIHFYLQANSDTGYGHLMRCLNLARHIYIAQPLPIIFLGNFDAYAQTVLQHYDFTHLIIAQSDLYSHFQGSSAKDSLLIIDSYQIAQSDIDVLAALPFPKVYFDDGIALFDYENKASAIISIRMVREVTYLSKKAQLFAGLQHFIPAPEMMDLRKKNLSKFAAKEIQDIRKILIFISGKAEGWDIAQQLLEILDSLAIHLQIYIIKAESDSTIKTYKNLSVTQLSPTPNMSEYLTMADAVISGGGLLKYEAAYCAIPGAIYAITDLQQEDTRDFCGKGLAYDLRQSTDIAKSLKTFIEDTQLRNQLIHQSGSLFSTASGQQLALSILAL